MATGSNGIKLGSSSIDVGGVVSALTAKKKAASQKALDTKTAVHTTRISAVGNFSSSLTALQNAMKGFADGSAFKSQKVAIGDSAILNATADTTAKSGHYDIVVKQLASAQKTTSPAYGSATTAVGTGNLTITVGKKSMSFNLDGTNNKLQNVVDKINNAKDNPGVTASIVTGVDGAHLVLSSSATGAANAF